MYPRLQHRTRTQPRSRTVSESGEERQVPRRGWAVCYLDTGRVHEMDCSVQLRQALEVLYGVRARVSHE